MVEVDLPLPEERRCRVRVSGHAGAGLKGQDIVCSAVSSLLLTYLGGLEAELGAVITGTLEEGNCDVVAEVPNGMEDQLTVVARIFRHGFIRLAHEYPERIRVIEAERGF